MSAPRPFCFGHADGVHVIAASVTLLESPLKRLGVDALRVDGGSAYGAGSNGRRETEVEMCPEHQPNQSERQGRSWCRNRAACPVRWRWLTSADEAGRNHEFQEVQMGNVLAMLTDPIADACEEAYKGEGMFADGGWVTIPRAVSRDLIPGEDFSQFLMGLAPNIEPVIDLDRLDQFRQVEWCRQRVDALVAPAVLAVAHRAQAEHWTPGELLKAMKGVADDYRPRVKRLADSASDRDE